ncbi:MAG TPA: S41 family peptidase [Stellaceae bacterium]|nr:S41 family peptidase [Stellaceae bacterium]
MLLAALAACSGGVRDGGREAGTGKLFARGIEQITDLYLDPIPAQKLVLVGAKNLGKLDSRLAVTTGGDIRDRDQLTLTYDGIAVGNYRVPPDIDDSTGGQIIGEMIAAAKKASPRVNATPEDLIDKAVFDGMTGALDRFSRYATPDEARDQRAARDGFGGIGVTLETANNDFTITAVSDNSPAQRAGVQVGDRIVAIDGASVAGRQAIDIIHQLRGPIGTAVTLTVQRAGTSASRNFKVERALVVVPTVTASRDGNIAIFRVASFNQSTTQRLTEAIIEAQRQANGRLAGIVIDLRGNPGGLLDQAVSLSDLFIAKGPIISTVGRHPASHQYFAATGRSLAPSTPLVVLINGGSASASEIVAAALQDVGRAVVIGTSSYGKGTVQTVMRLPNEGELTITWARLVTPSGYYLQQHGVVPTLCTSGLGGGGEAALDAVLRRPVDASDADASHPRASLNDTAWSTLRHSCPAQPTSSPLDLRLAERLLSDPARYSAALGAIHPINAAQAPPGAAALTAGSGGLSSGPRTP